MTIKIFSLKKTHGSVAPVQLMLIYLLLSLASKKGRPNIGDSLDKKNNSRMVAYLHFMPVYFFEP
ncbi:hypothetical protein D0T84_11660 [Dysgonomonas sp. 521]|nr:hypothetical protein [Dysgonomonas sp. 521]NDV95562.1 hypothetical protein [Dysgonomonas sp. 521]